MPCRYLPQYSASATAATPSSSPGPNASCSVESAPASPAAAATDAKLQDADTSVEPACPGALACPEALVSSLRGHGLPCADGHDRHDEGAAADLQSTSPVADELQLTKFVLEHPRNANPLSANTPPFTLESRCRCGTPYWQFPEYTCGFRCMLQSLMRTCVTTIMRIYIMQMLFVQLIKTVQKVCTHTAPFASPNTERLSHQLDTHAAIPILFVSFLLL